MVIQTEPLIPSLIHLSKASLYLANIYLFWVINRNNRQRFRICSKLTIKHQIDVIDVVLLPLMLTLDKFQTLFWCLNRWFWTKWIDFTHCSGAFITNFEQVNIGWDEVLSDTFSSIFFEALQSYLKNLNL